MTKEELEKENEKLRYKIEELTHLFIEKNMLISKLESKLFSVGKL